MRPRSLRRLSVVVAALAGACVGPAGGDAAGAGRAGEATAPRASVGTNRRSPPEAIDRCTDARVRCFVEGRCSQETLRVITEKAGQ